MGATYRKNPLTLAAVNPGKPPKAKKAKGGKSMAQKKRKSAAKRKSAPKTRTVRTERGLRYMVDGKFATKSKYDKARGKKSAKKRAKKKAKPRTAATAAKRAASAKRKSSKKRTAKQTAAARKNIKKAQAARKKKASLARRFNEAAAPKKSKKRKSAKRKSSKRTTPARYKSGAKKGQFKPKKARKAPKGRVTGASRTKKPKKAPSRNKKGQFTSRPRLSGAPARKGRMAPGWYPISGYTVGDRWGWRQNPAKIMPNGTILDPDTKKFISPKSARGRELLAGKRGGGSWLSNPVGEIRESVTEYGYTMKVALQQAAGLSVGFFGARALANYVSMASWTSRLPGWMVPYAPFAAQVATSAVIFAAGQKIDRVRPYQAAAMAGVGVSIIEALLNRFAPDPVREYVGVPDPGLGDSLDVYRRALGEGLDEGWYDYRSGDADLLGEYVTNEDLDPVFDIDGGMGEYLLEEDLDPVFDVGGGMGEYILEEDMPEDLGEYVTLDELDPVFDAVGDSSTQYDEVQARARAQAAMGEYVTPESLEEDFDIFGGVGDVTAASMRARDQIMMGDDQEDAVITNVHGPAVAAGMFGNGGTAKTQTAMALATTAVQAAKASGASPRIAAKQAIKAVRAGASIPYSQAKSIVGRAIRNAMSTKHQGIRQPAPEPMTPAAPELLPQEPDMSEFRQGVFAEGMFDPSDDE